MPLIIEQNKLFNFVKTIDGKLLTTSARKKQFQVNVVEGDIVFTPVSSGKFRKESSENLAKIIERYNDSKSLQAKDYHDITFNSAYIVTLIEIYLKSLSQ
jgi:hypothetical protein